jgi:ABC-type amino acid transport system permease subunit
MGYRERLTYPEALRIAWSFLWRGLVVSILSLSTGVALGFVLGFILGAARVEARVIQIVASLAGGGVGFFVWVPVAIRWTLPRDFGVFRLELVRAGPNPAAQAAVATVPLP